MRKVFNIFLRLQQSNASAFWASMAIAVVSPILGDIIAPLFFAEFTNRIAHNDPYNTVLVIVKCYLLFFGIRTVVWSIGNWLLIVVERKTMHIIADHTGHHLLSLSIDYFKNHSIGALVGKHNKFTRCYERMYDEFFFNLISSLVLYISIVVVLTLKMPLLGMSMMIVGGIFGYMTYRFSKYQYPYNEKVSTSDTRVTSLLSDQLNNISTIHAYGFIEEEKERFSQYNTIRSNHRKTSWEIGYIQWRVNDLFYLIMIACSVLTTIYLWGKGIFQLGDVILVITYTTALAQKLQNIGNVIKTMTQLITDGEEMIAILDTQPTVKDNGIVQCTHNGDVTFTNVTFGYDSNNTIFTDFSLTIKKGEKVGIVGESGSGKSTLVKLLLREMDIGNGSIHLNGHDIRDYTIKSLRSNIAIVPQEASLFHRSIYDNIAYARPEATLDEVIIAAQKAQAHDFIEKLSKKYETRVGEKGVKLSGGQRQRVALARAFLAQRPIIILDEATSALDSISETKIQFAMKEFLQSDSTMICIAHRLSTVATMDRIIVLEDGNIIEEGTHYELLEKGGLYAELWNKQLVFNDEEIEETSSSNDDDEIHVENSSFGKGVVHCPPGFPGGFFSYIQ